MTRKINSELGSIQNSQETINIKGIIVPLKKDKNEKIQSFVKKILHLFFDNKLLSENEIKKMLDENYCQETFGIEFPIIQDEEAKLIINGCSRYWSTERFGDKYYACSQWWRQYDEMYESKLSKWIKKIGSMNKK
jgi:hypothetical protein